MENTGKKVTATSLIMGVAFVWFTTHFGGGFASGAQLYSYFVRYGVFSIIMPVLAMGYNALFFTYCLRYARRHEVYDYRSYNNSFYGRFAPVFSNLFEFLYIVVMCVAPAVAFATGGATLHAVTGLPYLLCTLIIGAFIFVVAIFGTSLVRRVSFILSIVIIAGMIGVYVPNILANTDAISNTMATMQSAHMSFGSALYSAFIYGTFQLCNVAVFVQHAQAFEQPGDAKKSMLAGFVINAAIMVMGVIGLMTVCNDPNLANESVPTLMMVQKGVGASVLTPLISVLIILGAVTTAVNMVAAMVKRIGDAVETEEERKATDAGRPILKTVLIALGCCLVDFGIAQFGLLTLIAKAYSFIAYLAIPVILIPYIIHMVATRFDTKPIVRDAKEAPERAANSR
ncbi:MAG: hypothetical protein ACOX4I_04735 [Anaerovoracaceae bacterium]|jgi:uncharacterized membrane protein YkvI